MPAPVLQIKRGLASNVGLASFKAGEPGFTTDKYDFYIGLDGTAANQKFFGSSRYWNRENGSTSAVLNLVDKDGTNGIKLKAANTLAGIVTFTLPSADGTSNQAIVTDGLGGLSFATVTTSAATLTGAGAGVTTFLVTPSSANLAAAVTDETGSGALVFATSPTLVSPNIGDATATNLNVSGIATIGSGVGVTQFSGSVSTGTSTSSVPTSSAVIDYVGSQIGNVDLTLGINADTGGPSTVTTSQTLTIAGTANEVETSVASQTITVGLPNDVVVGTSLSAPTIKTATLQASDGTTGLTIANSTGALVASNNLTVNGDLYINGNTTQINTTELTVNDRTVTLGIQTGATPSTTTWDLGVMMNYGDAGVAKTAGVVWQYSTERFIFSANSDNPVSGNNTTTPVITVATYAPIEIGSLWVNDCAGQSQVISCTGAERFLENITVDAGTF